MTTALIILVLALSVVLWYQRRWARHWRTTAKDIHAESCKLDDDQHALIKELRKEIEIKDRMIEWQKTQVLGDEILDKEYLDDEIRSS